jgi:hypothetical protein
MSKGRVSGGEDLRAPMNPVSAPFDPILDDPPVDHNGRAYRNASLHPLIAETGCFRCGGQGRPTDDGRELCRRGAGVPAHDFP